MTMIKLCGLRRECDIRWVNELLPDYIGFIFAEKSRRYVEIEKAAVLKRMLDPRIKAAGVFVDAAIEDIALLAERRIIDVIQLHGSETECYIQQLRQKVHLPVMKAFRIGSRADVKAAEKSPADCVLLDSGTGGTGTAFDWELVQGMKRPYFLAGGLNLENVSEAIVKLNPYAVDVSSGIETDGYKDQDKMKEFVHTVRSVGRKEEEL